MTCSLHSSDACIYGHQLRLLDYGELDSLTRLLNRKTFEEKAEAMRATEKPLRDDDLSRLLQPQYVSYIDYDVMDDAQLDALTDLMLGANYVNCQPLLDLCCMKCASHIKNKTPEQIRQFLRIPEPLEKPEEDKLVEATRPNEQRDV